MKAQNVHDVMYSTWKASFKTVPSYYVPQGDGGYAVFNVGEDVVIQSRIAGESEDCADFEANYKSRCTETGSAADAYVLGALESSVPLVSPRSTRGFSRLQLDAPEGSKTQVISQNFCDKRTWYATSVRHNDVVMIDSGDGKTWTIPNPTIGVDVSHARILHERRLWPWYRPIVMVDGVAATEKDPHDNAGAFDIDYLTMSVTFDESQAGKSVTIDFNEVVDSKWYVRPTTGKILRLGSAELNFSKDVRMRDTFVFTMKADVAKCPYFAAYYQGNGGPYPAGTLLPLDTPVFYQTQRDLVIESNLSYPTLKKTEVGEGEELSWRDLQQDMNIYSWDYKDQATIDMFDSWGMAIEICLEHDVECLGDSAVITFYCTSEPENP